MFDNSEKIVNDAYNRMDLSNQFWNRYQQREVDFILSKLHGRTIQNVLDFGCGNGRHAIEFAGRGYETWGIDYSERNIQQAVAESKVSNVHFVKDDCRTVSLGIQADLALCLYDVIGSFIHVEDNQAILKNIWRHLRNGGCLAMSVMNLELTRAIAINQVPNVRKNLMALASLRPGKIMQNSGDIFKQEYFLLETETGIVYRKEQFENEGDLCAEYAIRDKRYSRDEICGLLEKVGFRILETRYVQAGKWEKPLTAVDPSAKEILIFAEKVSFHS